MGDPIETRIRGGAPAPVTVRGRPSDPAEEAAPAVGRGDGTAPGSGAVAPRPPEAEEEIP